VSTAESPPPPLLLLLLLIDRLVPRFALAAVLSGMVPDRPSLSFSGGVKLPVRKDGQSGLPTPLGGPPPPPPSYLRPAATRRVIEYVFYFRHRLAALRCRVVGRWI